MAVKVTTLQFQASTSGGTQNVAHGHGTTPQAALFVLTWADTIETVETRAVLGIGFSDGTDDNCLSGHSLDAQASTSTQTFSKSDSSIVGLTSNGIASAGFDATNLTLTWSDTPSQQFYINVVFFSGLDGVKVVEDRPTGTTTKAITHNLGLTTSNHALIFGLTSHKIGSNWQTSTGDWGFSFGVAAWNGSAFTERAFTFMEDNSETDGRPAAYLDTDDFLGAITAGYAYEYTHNLSDFQTNDFDITADAAAGNDDCAFLILGMPSDTDVWVGDIEAPTALGSKSYTPLSWTPQHVGMLATQIETKDSLRQDGNGDEAGARAFCITDGTTNLSSACAMENDSATTDTQCTVSDEFVYMPAHDGTLTGSSASAGNGCRATFTQFTSSGWDISTTGLSANSTQTYWIAWAIEGEGAGPAANPKGPLGHPLQGALGGPI